MMHLHTLGVIVCGTMGNGIVQVDAQNLGRKIVSLDLTDECKLSALNMIQTSTESASLTSAQLFIEAATDYSELKLRELQKSDALISADCDRHAASTLEHLIGLHLLNPVPMMVLIGIIRGRRTGDANRTVALHMSTALGIKAITMGNRPGFEVNQIMLSMINETILVFQEGLASAEDIGADMRQCITQPIAPPLLSDLIGLDIESLLRRLQRQQITLRSADLRNGRRRLPRTQDGARLP